MKTSHYLQHSSLSPELLPIENGMEKILLRSSRLLWHLFGLKFQAKADDSNFNVRRR